MRCVICSYRETKNDPCITQYGSTWVVCVCILYNKPPAMQVDPHPALALDNKTSNAIISVGPKPHYK